jgi:hypothetical protein
METSSPAADPMSGRPEPAQSSLMSRLFGVFAEPGEVFREISISPHRAAHWLVPAMILIVVSWLGALLIFSQESIRVQLSQITDQAIERQIQKSGMPESQAEQARAVGEKFGSLGPKIAAIAAPLFYAFLTPFWWGLLFWLVGKRIFHVSFDFMKGVEVAGMANMIAVLEAIVKSLLIVALGNVFASPSLALLVLSDYNPESTVHGLLAMVNVMTFWLLAVRAAGLSKLSGASFLKSAIWVFGLWAAFTGALFGFGVAMRMIFAR